MAFEKIATFSYNHEIKALNKPEGWEIFNLSPQIKLASIDSLKDEDLGGFDIKTATKKYPDHLYVKIFAIKEDEPNDNADCFSGEELKKAAHTFIGVPLFTNHQNDDVEKSRGDCVHAWYDKSAKGIYIIGRVDKVAYPKLARAIEQGYVTGTSMGTSVGHSTCSVCHARAVTAQDYCFEENTPILMADFTIKAIKDILVGDRVIDAFGKITKVTQLFKRNINEKISILKSRCINGELLVTKNHPFLVSRRGEYRYVPSEYINDNEILFMPIPQIEKNNFFFKKFGFDSLSEEDKKRLVAFLGYYAAEGSRIKRDGEIKALELTFHESEEDYVNEIRNICVDIFHKEPSIYRNTANNHIIRVRLWEPQVCKIIYSMCPGIVHKDQSKRFDESIFTLEDKYKIELLRAFIDGDGHCDSRNVIQIVSCCSGLSVQILYLILSLKSSPSFNCYRNWGGPSNREKETWAYRISMGVSQLKQLANKGVKCSKAATKVVSQSKLCNAITEDGLFAKHTAYGIDEADFEGDVYNIETESHSYVANNTSVHNCDHIKNRKNRKFSGEVRCSYHDSPDVKPEDKCPLCGSTKNDRKILKLSDQHIFEHNYDLKFIENSFVVNPACKDCGVKCILHVPEIQKKIASFNRAVDYLIKQSSNVDFIEENIDGLMKIGGIQELNLIKDSMNKLEQVVQSMLKQKDNVSMDFVSDLVKAMAELQETYDELNEGGYAKLPSSVTEGEGEPPSIQSNVNVQPSSQSNFQAPQMERNVKESVPGIETSDLGGLGNITKPKYSSKKIKDFPEIITKLENKISFLVEKLQKNNILKEIGENMAIENTKTAAGIENQEIITEKQLEGKVDINPRQSGTYEGVTESAEQLGGKEKRNDTTSESPQVRKDSTYETITEDQLGTTSASLVRYDSVVDVITEKQWNDMSRLVSANIDNNYTDTITEDQLKSLLKSHKFVNTYETITEDQLKNISILDGSNRWANNNYATIVVKVATEAIVDSIAKYKKSPEEINKVAGIIADNSDVRSKVAFLSVVNSLGNKTEQRNALANKVLYFSKIASSDPHVSTIDALMLSVADHSVRGIKSEDVFDSIARLIGNKTVLAKVEKMAKAKMEKIADNSYIDKNQAIDNAIKILDRPEDGLYRIKATLQDIGVSPSNKVAFMKGLKKFAQEQIDDAGVAAAIIKVQVGGNGELIIDIKDGAAEEEINENDLEKAIEGPIEEIVEDTDEVSDGHENLETEEVENDDDDEDYDDGYAEEGEEDDDDDFDYEEEENEDEDNDDNDDYDTFAKSGKKTKLASAKKEIIKTAQMMGGEMGGMGGMSQAPGAGGGMPQMPGSEAAPMQNLTQSPEDAGMEDDAAEGEAKKPLPPGSLCPVCGSEDVDIISGKGKCNNCTSEMTYKVEINVTKWKDLTPTGEEDTEGEDGFGEGEGFEMPSEGADEAKGMMPGVAAMVKLKPGALQKIAKSNIKLGSISPASGTDNTVSLGNGEHVCLATGTRYKVSYSVDKNNPKNVWAQWEWTPKVAGVNDICNSCSREKKQFVKALKSLKLTEAQFNGFAIDKKVKVIANMKKAGLLKTIKTANKNSSLVKQYKVAFGGYGDNFPCESCRAKLAKRFGENAVALSGPCEGKNLADCVCDTLKKADIYTDRIAMKIASSWNGCSPDEECVTDQIRSGYTLREAASLCSHLKQAFASPEELLADDLSETEDNGDVPPTDTIDDNPDFSPEDETSDVDPFEDSSESITIEIPKDIAQDIADQVNNNSETIKPEEIGTAEEGIVEEGIAEEGTVGEGIAEEGIVSPLKEEVDYNDETKPCLDGAEADITVFEEDIDESGNIPEEPKGKVRVSVDPSLTASNDTEYTIKEASNMKSKHGRIGDIHMDLSGVLKSLNKKAESEISHENAQDSKDIGKYTDGENAGTMGHENETIPTASKPSVPRDKSLMGKEDSDLNPQDKPQPSIPNGDATMGHEKEVGLSGGDNRYTGGDKGQGKTETVASIDEDLYHMKGIGGYKDSLGKLAERIKQAGEKKLEAPAPVADDKDIQPIKGDSVIGKEEKFDAKSPENTKGNGNESMMGHEQETVGDRPDSPKDHPSIPTGNAQMGKEELDSEKTTKDKGTVIAKDNMESEAYKLAGKMLEAKIIEASQLQQKVDELKGYKLAQLKDIEKNLFIGKKGFNSVSDGLSQAVVISETSSEQMMQKNNKENLVKKLASLFSLERRNELADGNEDNDLRKVFNK